MARAEGEPRIISAEERVAMDPHGELSLTRLPSGDFIVKTAPEVEGAQAGIGPEVSEADADRIAQEFQEEQEMLRNSRL